MTTYPSAAIDPTTADTLSLMQIDPVHRTDRDIILDAIETVAARHGGTVDPNELRREVHGLVYPKTIGATIQGLAKRGVLRHVGWTVTQGSTSGNNGRPAKCYVLTADPRAASPGAGRPRAGRGLASESTEASRLTKPEPREVTPPAPSPSVT